MHPPHTLVLTQSPGKWVALDSLLSLLVSLLCLLQRLWQEEGVSSPLFLVTPGFVEFQVLLEQLVLLGEVGKLWLRAGGNSAENHTVLCQGCTTTA